MLDDLVGILGSDLRGPVFAVPVDDDDLVSFAGDALLSERIEAALNILLLVIGRYDYRDHFFTSSSAALFPERMALSILRYSHSPNRPIVETPREFRYVWIRLTFLWCWRS